MQEKTKQNRVYHWLVVSYVSPGAREWIEDKGGRVLAVYDDPPLSAVALAYDPAGAWTWSRGEQELRQGIEFWSNGVLQEASTGIELQYRSMDTRISAEYCSVHTTYLILPDEEFDPETRQVKERGMYGYQPVIVAEDEDLPSLDDHIF